ncbi:MAG: energy transducer TonB [Tannerellaceae bacterium]|nr:energy transducer TonB [Tannerellaceae bacterium]
MIIDKNTLKGTYYELVNDYLGNMPIAYPMGYFSNGYFLMNMDPGDLHEQLEKHLENSKLKKEDRNYLTNLYNSISFEKDNNYLLIGKLKTKSHPIQFLSETRKENIVETTVSLPDEEKEIVLTDDMIHDEDTTIYDMPFNTPYLTTWKTYFPANNRFKDWPKDDEKMVMVGAVIEKPGKAMQVRIVKSSDNPELDAEAIRLIEEAPIDPAIDEEGNKVRSNFMIPVYFPPR